LNIISFSTPGTDRGILLITSKASTPKLYDLVTIVSKFGYASGSTIKGWRRDASENTYLKVNDFKSPP
jgi:hypothetical protein